MPAIKVPSVVWALGDREQSTGGGNVTFVVRPIYYHGRRVGEIDPDYAGPLMAALGKRRTRRGNVRTKTGGVR